jgi:hypothetical protein
MTRTLTTTSKMTSRRLRNRLRGTREDPCLMYTCTLVGCQPTKNFLDIVHTQGWE